MGKTDVLTRGSDLRCFISSTVVANVAIDVAVRVAGRFVGVCCATSQNESASCFGLVIFYSSLY